LKKNETEGAKNKSRKAQGANMYLTLNKKIKNYVPRRIQSMQQLLFPFYDSFPFI